MTTSTTPNPSPRNQGHSNLAPSASPSLTVSTAAEDEPAAGVSGANHNHNHNNNMTANDNNNLPQVRHAGRARIRGKIRRVWRSRYLELLDQGIVQYYEFPESPAPSSATDDYYCSGAGLFDSWHGANTAGEAAAVTLATNNNDNIDPIMIPKYTLQISHARILDPTTLRDMHVGLPRGTYGFTFRGQRLVPQQQQPPPPEHGESSNYIFSSLVVPSPSSIASQPPNAATTPTTTPTTTTFLHPSNVVILEPRDFLCAVPTLEEAQMWVVALQWAASERVVVESMSELRQEQAAEQQQQLQQQTTLQQQTAAAAMEDFVTVSVPTAESPMATTPKSTPAQETTATHNLNPQDTTTTTTTFVPPASSSSLSGSTTTLSTSGSTGSGGGGRAVVTKVTTLRLVRLSTWTWEWAYEIHGMFLWTDSNKTTTQQQQQHPQTTKPNSSSVQLWTVLRTAQDFGVLVQKLQREMQTDEATSSRLRMLVEPLLELPRLQARRGRQKSRRNNSPEALQTSITTVDGILRSLVTDAKLLRTSAMKSFLGLKKNGVQNQTTIKDTSNNKSTATKLEAWWQRLSEIHNSHAIVERRSEQLDDPAVKDAYVKQWLAKHQRQASRRRQQQQQQGQRQGISILDSCAAQVLQRPLLILGGLGASSMVALLPLAKWAWSLCDRSMPTISLRADHLVFTWMGAAYLGYQYKNSNQQSSSSKTTSRKTSARLRKQQASSSKSSQKDPSTAEDKTPVTEPDDDSSLEGEEAPVASTGNLSIASTDALIDSTNAGLLSSPLPKYPDNDEKSCWSQPPHNIFHVRSVTYLQDRVKEPSGPAPLQCRGVDVWINDNPERHIARHPAVLGGKLGNEDTFLVNFLLPFGNFVAYFSIPPLDQFPPKLRDVWTKFLKGDQQYRDARLKLLPVVAEGPWIVKAAVGPGKSPALLGKVIPLQYFFRDPDEKRAGVYEVDVIITASSIAKGILSVVKGNTKTVSIAFAFIIEAAEQEELPETVLCSCQVHFLDLEQCPLLPPCDLDDVEQE